MQQCSFVDKEDNIYIFVSVLIFGNHFYFKTKVSNQNNVLREAAMVLSPIIVPIHHLHILNVLNVLNVLVKCY